MRRPSEPSFEYRNDLSLEGENPMIKSLTVLSILLASTPASADETSEPVKGPIIILNDTDDALRGRTLGGAPLDMSPADPASERTHIGDNCDYDPTLS
jgi:hypothetical protein